MSGKKGQIALLIIAFGIWLIAVNLTFLHPSHPLFISDLISALVVIALGLFSSTSDRKSLIWVVAIVGVWLQFAPLVFWAPTPLTYLNDTLVGVMLIILAFTYAKKPTLSEMTPEGWSFNPSSWNHRIPTVGLAMLCWFFARYMAAFQLGYIDHVWDPFFPNGTYRVITSTISHSFPVPDAGLGALCYTLEALMGWQGGTSRWCQMPWLVLAFGFLVVPVGVISIILIILQPVIVGAWCSWCLATAAFMLVMIIFTVAEVAATCQFLITSKKSGKPFWRTFWHGGVPAKDAVPVKPRRRATKQAWGISVHWNMALAPLIGLFLMAAPQLLHFNERLSISSYIAGPMIITLSLISWAEICRTFRYGISLLGILLLIAAFAWSDPGRTLNGYIAIAGLIALILPIPRGSFTERYGMFERYFL